MGFTTSSIRVPDLGFDSIGESYKKERDQFDDNLTQLGKLYQIRDKAMANIPTDINPEIRKRIESETKGIDEQINYMSNVLTNNPREFAKMQESFAGLGMELYEKFNPNGVVGRVSNAAKEYNKRKQNAIDNGATEEDFKAFNSSADIYSRAMNGQSYSFRTPPERLDWNGKVKNVMSSIVKDQYDVTDYSLLGNGQIKINETGEIVNVSASQINEYLSRDPEVIQFRSQTSGVAGWNEKFLELGKDNFGRSVYYGVLYDKKGNPMFDDQGNIKKGETLNQEHAVSRTQYEMDKAIDSGLKFFGSKRKVKTITQAAINKEAKTKGAVENKDNVVVMRSQGDPTATNNEDVNYNRLTNNISESKSEYKIALQNYERLLRVENVEPETLESAKQNVINAKENFDNLEQESKTINEIAIRSLSDSQKEILTHFNFDPEEAKNELKSKWNYNYGRDSQDVVEKRNELKRFNDAFSDFSKIKDSLTKDLYSGDQEIIDVDTKLNLGKDKVLTNILKDEISETLNENDELFGTDFDIHSVSINEKGLVVSTSGGKKQLPESVKTAFLDVILKGDYGKEVQTVALINRDPFSRALMGMIKNTKRSLNDSSTDVIPRTMNHQGYKIQTYKTKQGVLRFRIADKGQDIKNVKWTTPSSGNPELSVILGLSNYMATKANN